MKTIRFTPLTDIDFQDPSIEDVEKVELHMFKISKAHPILIEGQECDECGCHEWIIDVGQVDKEEKGHSPRIHLCQCAYNDYTEPNIHATWFVWKEDEYVEEHITIVDFFKHLKKELEKYLNKD